MRQGTGGARPLASGAWLASARAEAHGRRLFWGVQLGSTGATTSTLPPGFASCTRAARDVPRAAEYQLDDVLPEQPREQQLEQVRWARCAWLCRTAWSGCLQCKAATTGLDAAPGHGVQLRARSPQSGQS